jgi:hypothetical protein
MMAIRHSSVCMLLVAGIALTATWPAAAADEVPLVDGKVWGKSAPVLKRSYLIGVANILSAEYAFQKQNGFPDEGKSSIRDAYENIDDITLDQSVARIDAWYAKNPDKLETTVLDVIWIDMVEPNTR